MKSSFSSIKSRVLITAVAGTVSFGSLYFVWKETTKPHAPRIPVISSCKALWPSMKRIGGKAGYQFDVPVEKFHMHQGVSDSPPWTFGFGLAPKDGTSAMEISFLDDTTNNMILDRAYNFSGHVEHRQLLDSEGRQIGEDYWGYWQSGERWRRFRLFKGRINARYDLADAKEAALFDQVLNSACILELTP